MDAARPLRLVFGGDAMLGRLVGEAIARFGHGYPLGPLAATLAAADLAIVNLECAITASTTPWPGEPKAFYFGAPPAAVLSLAEAGIDLVSLANNHALDFGVQGLRDTLLALDAHGIAHAGAGETLAGALRPALLERGGIQFGMAAFCDHQSDFAAAHDHPGIAWIDLEDEARAADDLRAALTTLVEAGTDWPVLSLHWGPNMVWRPSPRFRRLAHAAIDMGWKIVFGHSAHVFQGVEWRAGCPIVYAAGDLVDDYYVDVGFRNDHQMLFELDLDARRVLKLAMRPLFIEDCRSAPAHAAARDWIIERMRVLCRELGTHTEVEGELLTSLPQ